MKKLQLVLAVGVLLLAQSSYAPTATAAPLFEDPQVCLNGKLLKVEPTTEPIEVWVTVGPNVSVDFNVVNCGGDPNLPVLQADHLIPNGLGNWFEVAVKTKKHTDVLIQWDSQVHLKNSGTDRWVFFVRRAN